MKSNIVGVRWPSGCDCPESWTRYVQLRHRISYYRGGATKTFSNALLQFRCHDHAWSRLQSTPLLLHSSWRIRRLATTILERALSRAISSAWPRTSAYPSPTIRRTRYFDLPTASMRLLAKSMEIRRSAQQIGKLPQRTCHDQRTRRCR